MYFAIITLVLFATQINHKQVAHRVAIGLTGVACDC